MAKIINVEKSQYLNSNIEIYSNNKVGQYSKFLDKNPLFPIWFHINSAETRSDVGTGGVNADLGKNSPIRFNQINNLPVYNVPEFKPDTDYGENGYDIEMELSDLTTLPNTIKPQVGDYVLFILPNSVESMFRINSFSYNTIQSNDFYMSSADLKYTGHDLINKIKDQVVEEYDTIFENIGTDDKCFILKKDVEKIQNIGKIFLEMRETYYNNFFDITTGNFVCKENDYDRDSWFYDKFIEKFIMRSEIYYTENDEKSVITACADLEPPGTETLFSRTLEYAVLNNTTKYLADFPYYFQQGIQKVFSPFIINHFNCKGINLVIMQEKLIEGHSDGLDSGCLHEYYSHELISEVKTPSEEESESFTYLDKLICQFLQNNLTEIDVDQLVEYMLTNDIYTYLTMPLVMYIIMKYYDSYFKKTEL